MENKKRNMLIELYFEEFMQAIDYKEEGFIYTDTKGNKRIMTPEYLENAFQVILGNLMQGKLPFEIKTKEK